MDKKENTVVLFPQLSERYIDKGFLALKERELKMHCAALKYYVSIMQKRNKQN